jgi:hypothetical protein
MGRKYAEREGNAIFLYRTSGTTQNTNANPFIEVEFNSGIKWSLRNTSNEKLSTIYGYGERRRLKKKIAPAPVSALLQKFSSNPVNIYR